MKILAIIPTYNEERNIEGVINNIKIEEPNIDILLVDDGSSDKTTFIAEKTQKVTVITLPNNLGIGGAIQTGFKYTERKNYDIIVRVDGDGQHKAEEIKKIAKPILDKEVDIVIGSRFLNQDKSYPISVRRMGQKIISFLISVIIRQKITDGTSGFRCYNQHSIILLNKYYPTDYPEPEEIIFLKKNKFKIKEVGVFMGSREEGSSSLTTIKSLYYMVKVILSIFISILRNPVIKGN
jgi:glycosyltransferase involved in cell wall biosynthesis